MAEAGVQSGGRIIGPAAASDDGWRAPETAYRALNATSNPRALGDGGPPVDRVTLARIDVVAHLYGLVRRPGEDDASLATRVRRGAGFTRPAVPPMAWEPPVGFKLGDDWKTYKPKSITAEEGTRRRFAFEDVLDEIHTIEANPCSHRFSPITLLCHTCGITADEAVRRTFAARTGIDIGGDAPMKRVN